MRIYIGLDSMGIVTQSPHLITTSWLTTYHLMPHSLRIGIVQATFGSFTKRVNSIALQLGLGVLRFHGIRIGSVLEYRLRGLPLEVVKSMGRWSSNAFAVYLWKRAVILAPYIQNDPVLAPFTWVTLPPVHY